MATSVVEALLEDEAKSTVSSKRDWLHPFLLRKREDMSTFVFSLPVMQISTPQLQTADFVQFLRRPSHMVIKMLYRYSWKMKSKSTPIMVKPSRMPQLLAIRSRFAPPAWWCKC